jgi:hypothetical protein
MTLENNLHNYPSPYLTEVDLDALLEGSADSRYGKVKRMVAQGKLLHMRRGLYYLPETVSAKPHPFELAQHIYAPSYISLESALAHHKLIPEAVYTVTSVCTKRSKEFHTPLGIFSFSHLPLENFYVGVELITENNYRYFMAKPWKAICDYVFCYKSEWDHIDQLLESMRINPEDLPFLRDEEIEILKEYYHHSRVTRFLKNIKRDLQI